jgi:hypothetical protein
VAARLQRLVSSLSDLHFPTATQLAKTTLFASGNEADPKKRRRRLFPMN